MENIETCSENFKFDVETLKKSFDEFYNATQIILGECEEISNGIDKVYEIAEKTNNLELIDECTILKNKIKKIFEIYGATDDDYMEVQ